MEFFLGLHFAIRIFIVVYVWLALAITFCWMTETEDNGWGFTFKMIAFTWLPFLIIVEKLIVAIKEKRELSKSKVEEINNFLKDEIEKSNI